MKVYIPVGVQRQLRAQFANSCSYCRSAEHLTATTFEFEHIVPRSVGGETMLENLCLACPMCNRFKSDHLAIFDPDTQAEVPLFHPQRDTWTAHFAWNEAGTEVVGLTPVGRASIIALRMNRPQMIRVRKMWVLLDEHPPRLE